MVGFLLEVLVQALPLFLESCNQLLAFLLRHQHLLLVSLVLLLNLHLSHEVVLVFDLGLDFGNVLGHFSVRLLLKVVFVLLCWQFRSRQNVFDCIGYDEVLVGDQSVDWLLVLAWNGWLPFPFSDLLLD